MSDRLLDRYDAVLLDLDGTVYRGTEAIPGAPETIKQIRDAGKAVRFVTNNASRSPNEVADHLAELGIPVDTDEVRTSAQAAAAVLRERLEPGAGVLVVGTEALADEVRLAGLRPLREASAEVSAVVQGLSREVGWRELSEAVLAVRAGALWIACNDDATLPTERGELIGNGALVAAVAAATKARPEVAGKPNRPLMDQAAAGARKSLVVGDRLDTDIEGAEAAELDVLMVLSGVSTPRELLESGLRPTYVAQDITALTEPVGRLAVAETPYWTIDGGAVRWAGDGHPDDPIALLRVLCAARVTNPSAGDDVAHAALTSLGLA
jgi:glycerol-1-phosphatase